MRGALFEKDVGFVEEEDGVPLRDHLKHVAEGGFDLIRGCSKVAGGHHVERCSHALGDYRFVASEWCSGRGDEDSPDSAVNVLPTPGGPESNMIMPLPLP